MSVLSISNFWCFIVRCYSNRMRWARYPMGKWMLFFFLQKYLETWKLKVSQNHMEKSKFSLQVQVSCPFIQITHAIEEEENTIVNLKQTSKNFVNQVFGSTSFTNDSSIWMNIHSLKLRDKFTVAWPLNTNFGNDFIIYAIVEVLNIL